MSSPLLIQTQSGLVLGFADTFPLRDKSAATEIDGGADGGKAPVSKWLGIPYAQAARWTRPSPPAAWTTPLRAFEFGSLFPQPASSLEVLFAHQPGVLPRAHFPTAETSHTVNVFAPSGAHAGEDLPVLVWIYGGSLVTGSDSRMMYDATEWVRRSEEQGKRVIVVTANYRVGVFGFFAGQEVVDSDPKGLSGNYGLYDCVAFFEWVQNNISAFGGSPSRVTAFGESAGAFLLSHLLVSGKKLFQRAIFQSGATGTMKLRPPTESYAPYSSLLSAPVPSAATPAARLEALRKLPTEDLQKLHEEFYKWGGVALTLESGEHAVWGEQTVQRLRRGKWDEWITDVVVGTNGDEGSLFVWGQKMNTPQVFDHYLLSLRPEIRDAVRAKYSPPSLASVAEDDYLTSPMSLLLADQLFVQPAWDLACSLSGSHSVRKSKTKVWMYRNNATIDRISEGLVKLGAMHAIEIGLVFNTSCLWNEGDHEEGSATALGTRWVDFATSGNPDPEWREFDAEKPEWLVIEKGGETRMESLAGFGEAMVDFVGDAKN